MHERLTMAQSRDSAKDFVRFKRNRFAARFPADYLYSGAHFWLSEATPGLWRIGLTSFATRMLGEIVEFDFEVAPGDPVRPGVTVGWVEGFKAISDLYCVAEGKFGGGNPEAMGNAELVCQDPYGQGWLYSVTGSPDEKAMNVEGYMDLLNLTIDKMQEKPWQSSGIEQP